MKIDLHVHCRERSNCARASEEEQITAAIRQGLDALVFTDHDRLVPVSRLEALNRRFAPFRIFGGVEISLGNEHALVIGVRSASLEAGGWDYNHLHQFVRANQGFLALAHPFRFRREIEADLAAAPPDAMEVYSVNTPAHAEVAIRAIAGELQIPLLSDSDAHITEPLGRFYNQLNSAAPDEAALVRLLRAGQFTCHKN